MAKTFVGYCLQSLTRVLKKRRQSHHKRPDFSELAVECDSKAELILGATKLGPLFDRSTDEVEEYTLAQANEAEPSTRLIGIEVWTWGRFANAVFANIYAISVADHLGLEHVVLCATDGFVTDKVLDYKGMKVYSRRSLLKAGGWLLRGPFWDVVGWPGVARSEQRLIACSIIRRLLVRPTPPEGCTSNELAIHIRGGDVFGDDVNPGYVQPPLAYYRTVVRIASARYGIERIRIVAEDRLNPCLEALEDHLRREGIPFVYQSSSLVDDFASLLDIEHFAYGVGTFGPAVCILSDGIRSVFSFLPNPDFAPEDYYWIEDHHVMRDIGGAYIKQFEWRNDEAQRRQMLEYPDHAVGERLYSQTSACRQTI